MEPFNMVLFVLFAFSLSEAWEREPGGGYTGVAFINNSLHITREFVAVSVEFAVVEIVKLDTYLPGSVLWLLA